jgi:hypothetical protein
MDHYGVKHWDTPETRRRSSGTQPNACGGRLSTCGARDIITAIAADANLHQEFSSHVLRHTFRHRHDPWQARRRGRRRAYGPPAPRDHPLLNLITVDR